jgi:hypothetical protein
MSRTCEETSARVRITDQAEAVRDVIFMDGIAGGAYYPGFREAPVELHIRIELRQRNACNLCLLDEHSPAGLKIGHLLLYALINGKWCFLPTVVQDMRSPKAFAG